MSEPSLYAIIPARVRYDRQLNPVAILLYGEITASLDTYGKCEEDNEYFAKLLNVDIGQIYQSIGLLEHRKHINILYFAPTEDNTKRRVITIREAR